MQVFLVFGCPTDYRSALGKHGRSLVECVHCGLEGLFRLRVVVLVRVQQEADTAEVPLQLLGSRPSHHARDEEILRRLEELVRQQHLVAAQAAALLLASHELVAQFFRLLSCLRLASLLLFLD